jgi:SAM-dependent methyltransferase
MIGLINMIEEIKKYTEANREAWNETMPKHQAAAKEELDKCFSQAGYIDQEEEELEEFLAVLYKIDIKNKDVIHLCCNNGTELLSLKNLGAGRCVGIDISDEAVIEAKDRAQKFNIDCQFIRSDVYDISEDLYDSFDIVHISAGGIGWIPDLNRFYKIAACLLRKGGILLFHEIHPFSETIPFDDVETDNPLQIIDPYFRDEPIVENSSLDYVGGTEYEAKTQYWSVHTISDLLMGMINNGLTIEHFSEHERDISEGHSRQEKLNAGVPLSYILIGRKG